MAKHLRCALLDIDGTLVDSNDAHASAWIQAINEQGHQVSFEKVRPLIGMGGDKVLPEVLGISKDSPEGQVIGKRRKEIFFTKYLPTLHAFPQSKELLEHMHQQGLQLVVATSAEPDELSALLQVIGPHVSDLFTEETTAKDAPHSKPDPDVIHAALQRAHVQADESIMLGDTSYDIQAALRSGVQTIAFRCGGWSDHDLQKARAIYDGPADLLAHYNSSLLVREQG